MRVNFLIAAAVAAAIASAGAFMAFHAKMEQSSRPPALPVIADLGGDFELSRTDGSRFRLRDYRGRIVLLFFGYTHCPDVCPTSLYTLKLAIDELGKMADRVQVIMVTVDPERDSAEYLEQYVRHFHPQFIGLSGTTEEIEQVARQYRVYRQKSPASADGYLVTHSAYVYLLDQQGKVRTIFGAGTKQSEIADGVRQLLQEN